MVTKHIYHEFQSQAKNAKNQVMEMKFLVNKECSQNRHTC